MKYQNYDQWKLRIRINRKTEFNSKNFVMH